MWGKRNWADFIPKELKIGNTDCTVLKLVLCIICVAYKNFYSKPYSMDNNLMGKEQHCKRFTAISGLLHLGTQIISSSCHRWVAHKVYSFPFLQPTYIRQNSASNCSLPWSSFENGLTLWVLQVKFYPQMVTNKYLEPLIFFNYKRKHCHCIKFAQDRHVWKQKVQPMGVFVCFL